MARTLGYVDDVTPRAVVGWIANLDDPGSLEQIVCEGSSGENAVFRPFLPRQDVCQALSLVGRFGFVIPTWLLHPLGPVVTFKTMGGISLEGGVAVRLPEAERAMPSNEPTRIVLHIPKTGGTSLRSALTGSLNPWEVALVYPDPFVGVSLAEFAELPLAQRRVIRLLMGHCAFGVNAHIPGAFEYVTVVRQVEARLRSNYYHHLSHGTEFQLNAAAIPLARVVQHGLSEEFDNLMTRVIAGVGWREAPIGHIGEQHVHLALRNIASRFRFVGLTDVLEEHYPRLCRAMGIPLGSVSVENVRQIQDVRRADAEVDWDEALYRNRFDAMLYERVQAEGLCGRDLAT